MDQIVDYCSSSKKVRNDLDNLVNALKKAFSTIETSQTLKIHIILKHLKRKINFLGENGLGVWSELSEESIHREFLKFWKKHKNNILGDPDDPRHL